jgi:outer membrane protein assembly factor BamB
MRKRKMQKLKNKTMAIMIALLLTISMSASMILIPNTTAHSPTWSITDHAYIAVEPNPTGVGQSVMITIWTAQPLPNSAITNNIRKQNYVLTVTAPDGTNTTQNWDIIPNTGGIITVSYTPSQVGNYTLTFNSLGMTYPKLSQVTSTIPLTAVVNASINAAAGDIYTPETSVTTLTVQQEPLPEMTYSYPLPTDYWTRPIESQNTYWYSIASNWLSAGSAQFGSYQINGYNLYQPDGTGPTSSHIMWTLPIEFGGVVGGSNTGVPGATYYSGSSYESRFVNAIIMNGFLYFKMPFSNAGSTFTTINGVNYGGAYVCLDLRTGHVVWSNSNPGFDPTWGQLYNEVDPNQSGVIPSGYLYQSITVAAAVTNAAGSTTKMANVTWEAFDGYTGNWVFNITNVPQATTVYGPDGAMLTEQNTKSAYDSSGALLIYCLNYNTATKTGWLALWNSSALLQAPPSGNYPYRPIGLSLDASNPVGYNIGQSFDASYPVGYSWNVTINANLNGLVINQTASTGVSLTGPSIYAVIPGDIMFGSSGILGTGRQFTQNPFTMWAINLNASKGTVGQAIWVQNYTAPELMTNNPNVGSYTLIFGPVDPTHRVITVSCDETFQWWGYSLDTGTLLWGPTNTNFASDQFQYFAGGGGPGQQAVAAYGNIYVQAYSGVIYCYNTAKGNLLWTWGNGGEGNSTFEGLNSPWGNLPIFLNAICNGMVYVSNGQHGNGAQSPYYKNEMVYCLNATTGQQIWSIFGMTGQSGGGGTSTAVLADGEFVYYNYYDNQIYAIGQGTSQTTVTAPNVGVTTATPVTISGTVMDISAGTKQNEQAADFPNGVPCVSDASQSAWMEYVYMQKPLPTNATGVPVTISVIDSNGNFRQIGTTTTDSSGTFGFTWTPDITGSYTVIATFLGSNSYWGSSAEAHFYASSPAATPAPTEAPAQSTADMYFIPAIAGLFVFMAIIGVVIILVLRKRP